MAAQLSHYSPAQISAIAQSHGAPKWLGDALGATSVPESGGDPHAVNPRTKAAGLLQVYPVAWPQLAAGGNLEDADYNIQSALYIIGQQGSSAWLGSGTWRGPAVHPGQFHFPKPSAGAAPTAAVAATAAAAPSSGVSGDIAGMFAGPLMRGLLYLALVGGGLVVIAAGAYRAADSTSGGSVHRTARRVATAAV